MSKSMESKKKKIIESGITSDAKLNRTRFQNLINEKRWNAKEFWDRWTDKYGIIMGYNNFMELINNNVSWKLVYAISIADMLDVEVSELFEFYTSTNDATL